MIDYNCRIIFDLLLPKGGTEYQSCAQYTCVLLVLISTVHVYQNLSQ